MAETLFKDHKSEKERISALADVLGAILQRVSGVQGAAGAGGFPSSVMSRLNPAIRLAVFVQIVFDDFHKRRILDLTSTENYDNVRPRFSYQLSMYHSSTGYILKGSGI